MSRTSFLFVLLIILYAALPFVFAETMDHELPDVRHVNGIPLKRNGHGLRSISLFGFTNIPIYVAGFYSESAVLTEEAVWAHHEASRPMQLDFTFLRSVGLHRVVSAWTKQLDHSCSYQTYENYPRDRDTFLRLFASPIDNGGTQTVQLIGDETVIVHQGDRKGSIVGKDFQKAFLSMWFGARAVTQDLKQGLLSGALHLAEQEEEKEETTTTTLPVDGGVVS